MFCPCAQLGYKRFLKKVDFLKNAFAVLLDYISKKLVRRYCETRWNSIFDRFVDLQKHLTANGGPQSEISCVTAAIGALEHLSRHKINEK